MKNEETSSKLANFPIMLFAVIMGLGGLTLSYEKLNLTLGLSDIIFEILRSATSLIFIAIAALYGIKIIKFKDDVKKEISHPVKINFFAAFAISLFLLSAMWSEFASLHSVLFYIALVLQTFFTFYVIAFWINNNLLINHSNPAWFIPIVGNLVVVIASDSKSEFLWYYFSIGLFFWLVLFTIVFYRIIFHDQLAQKFMPTLFIVIAPPAIAFLGYTRLVESFDVFAHVLLNLTIFFTGLILFMYKNFMKLKFFLSWWAFTFPTAAASMTFVKAYELSREPIYLYFGVIMFVLLLFFIGVVGYFTIKAIKNDEICVAEH
ncbi:MULTISPECIES: SLAC1 anion channel family protein [Campylobacter]|uniref:SLAC1 anion channel family protein n=1 Tax=Campylobacter TaxID=194 RepID=UPI001474790A|nr:MULTISPECIES: SLAC1 anion channel family protein [unclassified Campylobacter]MBE3022274.1 SLAC1 anion channel family protein [Campylobacter sp. 7477a]MBE3610019.1 SLAC1 anion channel family protein [Campylobacter sp. RM12916]